MLNQRRFIFHKTKTDLIPKNGARRTLFDKSGNSFKGEWKNDLKHGFGIQKWPKKNIAYSGNWENGKRHGLGMLYPLNKDDFIYNGMWKNGKRNGQGIQHYPDGGAYDGHWRKGKRNGYGRMSYGDGCVYDGTWRKDEKCGLGTMTYADGSVYSGEWQRDMKLGHGELTTSKKDVYKGTWQNSLLHGEASYFRCTLGTELAGIWLRGIPRCGTVQVVKPGDATCPRKSEIPECTLRDPQKVLQKAGDYYKELMAKDLFVKAD